MFLGATNFVTFSCLTWYNNGFGMQLKIEVTLAPLSKCENHLNFGCASKVNEDKILIPKLYHLGHLNYFYCGQVNTKN